ncbi:MAG: hypothetical protein AAF847_07955 [Bacteroidota bacterium]
MIKILKSLLLLPIVLMLLWIVFINIKLHDQPKFVEDGDGIRNVAVLHQLNHIGKTIENGAAQDMQRIYPEGFLFLHALYVLSWADIAVDFKSDQALLQQSIRSMDQSLGRMQSEEGKRIFPKNTVLKYGAFYNGWTAYAMGKRLSLARDSLLDVRFRAKCKQIAMAYQKSSYEYLESYYQAIWPADNMVCLAALALHDQLYLPKYQTIIDSCLIKVKLNLDQSTGLIPHAVDAQTLAVSEKARGSSQSLMNNFLIEINSTFAKEQFDIYQSLFLEKRLGLLGIREYPIGVEGTGDIDAGPVLWDIGGAASLVGMRTFMRYGKLDIARSLQNTVEAFGLPFCLNQKKCYLLGVLPMADVFIAWGNALNQKQLVQVAFPSLKFHLISLGIALFLGFLSFKLIRNF